MSQLLNARPTRVRDSAVLLLVAAAAALSGCVHRYERARSKVVEEPPEGMAQVDVVSSTPEPWNVYANNDQICTTPCTQWIDPMQPLYLESQGRRRDRIWLPGVGPEAMETRNALLVATGSDRCQQTTGIVFTTFGGMGGVVAITLTAIGCSDMERRGGMCTAGLITGAASLPLTAWAIWMILDSGPRAEVFPVFQAKPAPGQPPVTLNLAPTGVSGTF